MFCSCILEYKTQTWSLKLLLHLYQKPSFAKCFFTLEITISINLFLKSMADSGRERQAQAQLGLLKPLLKLYISIFQQPSKTAKPPAVT